MKCIWYSDKPQDPNAAAWAAYYAQYYAQYGQQGQQYGQQPQQPQQPMQPSQPQPSKYLHKFIQYFVYRYKWYVSRYVILRWEINICIKI